LVGFLWRKNCHKVSGRRKFIFKSRKSRHGWWRLRKL